MEKQNTFPSSAHLDAKGLYVHDPLNQTLAEHEKNGYLGAHDGGQRVHPFGAPGYCSQHLVLGCTDCN
jgi:hypothetical protein